MTEKSEGASVYVVQVVVAVGIVLATVLVAGGRGDGLQPADAGRARTRLPSDRPLVADDLQRVRLGVGLRGYRMDEVDEVMDRAAVELAQRDERIADLERMRAVAASTAPPVAPVYASASPAPATDEATVVDQAPPASQEPAMSQAPATGQAAAPGQAATWPTSAPGREWVPTDG